MRRSFARAGTIVSLNPHHRRAMPDCSYQKITSARVPFSIQVPEFLSLSLMTVAHFVMVMVSSQVSLIGIARLT
jgi:hypothetical protein